MNERQRINLAIENNDCSEIIITLYNWALIWKNFNSFILSKPNGKKYKLDIKNRVLTRILDQCKKGRFRPINNEKQISSYLRYTLAPQVYLEVIKEKFKYDDLPENEKELKNTKYSYNKLDDEKDDEIINLCINQMDTNCKNLLLDYYYSDKYTLDELAQDYDTTKDKIRHRKKKCVEKLKECVLSKKNKQNG